MNLHQIVNICLKSNQISLGRFLKKILLQQSCLLCKSSDGDDIAICTNCRHDLPWHNKPHCPQCGLLSFKGHLCGHCLASPPAFDLTHSLFTYDFPLDALVHRYKYAHALNLAHTFAHLMATNIHANDINLIIPMPMHPTRLKTRGFNQALEIAKIVSKIKHITLNYKSCVRQKLTPPQASLPLKDRVKNIKGAFTCTTSLTGLRIAIIDDVMTTGASLNELAKSLKKAGATHVECWVVARTLPNDPVNKSD